MATPKQRFMVTDFSVKYILLPTTKLGLSLVLMRQLRELNFDEHYSCLARILCVLFIFSLFLNFSNSSLICPNYPLFKQSYQLNWVIFNLRHPFTITCCDVGSKVLIQLDHVTLATFFWVDKSGQVLQKLFRTSLKAINSALTHLN